MILDIEKVQKFVYFYFPLFLYFYFIIYTFILEQIYLTILYHIARHIRNELLLLAFPLLLLKLNTPALEPLFLLPPRMKNGLFEFTKLASKQIYPQIPLFTRTKVLMKRSYFLPYLFFLFLNQLKYSPDYRFHITLLRDTYGMSCCCCKHSYRWRRIPLHWYHHCTSHLHV